MEAPIGIVSQSSRSQPETFTDAPRPLICILAVAWSAPLDEATIVAAPSAFLEKRLIQPLPVTLGSLALVPRASRTKEGPPLGVARAVDRRRMSAIANGPLLMSRRNPLVGSIESIASPSAPKSDILPLMVVPFGIVTPRTVRPVAEEEKSAVSGNEAEANPFGSLTAPLISAVVTSESLRSSKGTAKKLFVGFDG